MEHKARSLISASVIFLGLLVPLRFPDFFWYILGGVSLMAALLVFWVFGEYPTFRRISEDWFTILFIFFFTGVTGLFAYLVPNPFIEALILGSIGFMVYYLYQVASRLKRGYTPSLFLRNIISFTAILGIFFAIADILRWVLVFDNRISQVMIIVLTFFSVFIICEFLFEAQGIEKSLLYSLVLSFVISQLVWISSFWLISYPQSERITVIGVPLPAILGTVIFYLFWGLSQHRLEEKLTRRVLWEYIFISSTFILILFLTAKWRI